MVKRVMNPDVYNPKGVIVPIPPSIRREPIYELGFVSPMLFCDGYGVAAQNVILALDKEGIRIRHYRNMAYGEEHLKPRMLEILRESKSWECSSRIMFYTPWDYAPRKALRGTRNIGFTMFETTQIPKNWESLINDNVERLFVPCETNKELFASCGVRVPVDVIPLGIEPAFWPVVKKKNRRDFVFLIQGLLDKRKGADVAIAAFEQAFPRGSEKVKLLLKTRDGIFDYDKLDITDRMHLIDQRLSHEGMLELYSLVDCFVFPTRGEGFGQPPLEALATGTPIIVTNDGATGEYFDKKYMYGIENTGLVTCCYYNEAWGNLGEWMQPSVEDCAAKMRYVYNNREEAIQKALSGAKWVKKKYNIANTAILMKKKLEEIGFFG